MRATPKTNQKVIAQVNRFLDFSEGTGKLSKKIKKDIRTALMTQPNIKNEYLGLSKKGTPTIEVDSLENIQSILKNVINNDEAESLRQDYIDYMRGNVADEELKKYLSYNIDREGVSEVFIPTSKLNKDISQHLINFRYPDINFNKVKYIDEEIAEALATLKRGDLILDGLVDINETIARSLSKLPNGSVSLSSISNIPLNVANSLSKLQNGSLTLGVRKLDPETAKELAKLPNGDLYLNGVISLDSETAKELAKLPNGDLYLNGVISLDSETAKELINLESGEVYLNGLQKLDIQIAKILSKKKIEDLHLNGLKIITEDVLQEILKLKDGDVFLEGLDENCITEPMIAMINTFNGNVVLPENINKKLKNIHVENGNSHPKISIITGTHKPDTLKQIVTSVTGQTYGDFEWLIIDDTKTLEDKEKLKKIVNSLNDIRVRIIENKDRESSTISKIRNLGVESAKGELIAFLDHDDLWHLSKLRSQIRYLKKNPDIGLVGTNVINIADDGTVRSYKMYDSVVTDDSAKLINNMPSLMSSILVRKELLDGLKNEDGDFLDEDLKYTDDYELLHRLVLLGDVKIGNIQKNLTYYTMGTTNTTSKNEDNMTKESTKAIWNILLERWKQLYKDGDLDRIIEDYVLAKNYLSKKIRSFVPMSTKLYLKRILG